MNKYFWVSLLVLFSGVPCFAAQTAPPTAAHTLTITLDPAQQRLTGSDEIVLNTGGRARVHLRLGQRITVNGVTLNSRPRQPALKSGLLEIGLKENERHGNIRLRIDYQGVFKDPVPIRPANTEDPGYGVVGVITAQGAFLAAEAGWYPDVVGLPQTFDLTVVAPAGMPAVTAGHLIAHRQSNGHSLSHWRVDRSMGGVPLAAGWWRHQQKRSGRLTAAVYFSEANLPLADAYLAATTRYLERYTRLFGPYAFNQFAVVENFFPTGYGFASFTLLGKRVLRLPFIIDTSLGHEIAHCWWGNGVIPDYAQGNWSEALTTYLADYLNTEQASAIRARSYRRQMLRNYATLVTPEDDMPLTRFRSRYSPATRAVGYDKGAMVFHMLRQKVGDAVFFDTLRRLYAQRRFKKTGWSDLQAAFEAGAQRRLSRFFQQWVTQPGAPRFALQDVVRQPSAGRWQVTGTLIQSTAPFYALKVPLAIQTTGEQYIFTISTAHARTPFQFTVAAAPELLTVDPDFDILRRLYPAEIPPTVNALKSRSNVIVVTSNRLPPNHAGIAAAIDTLIRGLGVKSHRIMPEDRFTAADGAGRDLLFIGLPQPAVWRPILPSTFRLTADRLTVEATPQTESGDSYFAVHPHPSSAGKVAGLFLPLAPDKAPLVARKIAHYGKYSYLLFNRGSNRHKGVWPTRQSPVMVKWTTTADKE